ncbi:MAG: Ldh family oxidoreductase [Acidiplasma aeolicum]|jgi:LDH2 family malate/lactate/ureidoglycolate dehydrogenase
MNISENGLRKIIIEILDKRGVEGSEIIADHFVEAELRGHSSHGLQRLIPLVNGLDLGTIKNKLDYKILKKNTNYLLIDAQQSIGIVLWEHLINTYKNTIIAVKNASHIGFLGYYTRTVAEAGEVAIMFGNAEPVVVMPKTNRKLLSTSPLSISIPCSPIIVLDMALSATARGKIIEAQRKGINIPDGVAVDKNGNITTNPNSALEGGILPLGGTKGFYLMLMFDMLTSFLSTSAISPNVKGVLNTQYPSNKGEVLIKFKPSVYNCYIVQEFSKLVGDLPGIHSDIIKKERLKNGIPINDKLYNDILMLK